MTDRELLELAARAAGLDLEWCGPWACMARNLGVIDGFDRHTCWDPLKDDGDALRLAVKLRLTIEQSSTRLDVYAGPTGTAPWSESAHDGQDIYEATRRAVVRAAAEIGKTMP